MAGDIEKGLTVACGPVWIETEGTMDEPDEVQFSETEIDLLVEITVRHRQEMVAQLMAAFPEREVASVLFATSLLLTMAFTSEVDDQHGAAMSTNQVLERATDILERDTPVMWRMAPIHQPGQ